ncbi:MAG: ATP synthase subunit I [Novosphingobium sp.]|nr:ATP synthase subunit I [Novosphingobium sp.]
MTVLPSPGLLAQLALWLGTGLVLGLAFFASLRRNVALYAEGRPLLAGLLHAGRIAVVVAVLAGAVHFGAEALLACSLGLLAGRWLVMRGVRKELP